MGSFKLTSFEPDTYTHTRTNQHGTESCVSFLLPNWCHSCCRFSAAFCVFFQPSSFVLMFLSLRIAFYQLPCCGCLAVANLSVWIETKIYNAPVWPVHIICVLSEGFLMWTMVSLCPWVFTKPICIHDYFPCLRHERCGPCALAFVNNNDNNNKLK